MAILLAAALTLSGAQLIKTSLNLTVRDELGNTVQGATVNLYETEANYTEEKNPAATGTTDAKGVVKFKELKAIPYFVIVRKGDLDNAGAGEQIGKLEANKINKATVIIR
ncbi:MAG: carboxypeptidase regulatory-like domain-containing protein [Cyclobacteriaceae bacterium]|nr:carboxypeptidase regulatory-like domain-containing protein [Cyclobacteriaceae bacterium]